MQDAASGTATVSAMATGSLRPYSELTLWQLMEGDLRAWANLWCAGRDPEQSVSLREGARLTYQHCGLRATLIYRLSHGLWRMRVPAIPGMLQRLNLTLHGLDIPACVEAGPGLYLPHPVGMVIFARRIGSDVSLIASITIGMRNSHEFPTIGDHVFVGAGARILGNVTIGDGAKVGANAVVLRDVPPGATAVGVPATIRLPEEAG